MSEVANQSRCLYLGKAVLVRSEQLLYFQTNYKSRFSDIVLEKLTSLTIPLIILQENENRYYSYLTSKNL